MNCRFIHSRTFKSFIILLGILAIGVGMVRGEGDSSIGDPREDLKVVRGDLKHMDRAQQDVGKMLKRAKVQKDIIRVSCIHEKLVRIKNINGLAREQLSRYLMERTSGIDSASIPLKQKIKVFKERIDDLVGEASRCAGESIAIRERPEVKEEIDPSLPREDSTKPMDYLLVLERPPEASPFK